MEQDRIPVAAVLERLRDHIGDAYALTEDRSPGELVADHLARRALERCIAVVAEATRRIPREWCEALPDIRWPELAVMAERLHDPAEEVAVEQLWQVVETDLPAIESALDDLVARANPQQ